MMEEPLCKLLIACFLKTIFQIEIINDEKCSFQQLRKKYSVILNDEIINIAINNPSNDLSNVIAFVDKNYIGEANNYLMPLKTSFSDDLKNNYFYDPSIELFSEKINNPQKKNSTIKFDAQTFLDECFRVLKKYKKKELLFGLMNLFENYCSYITILENNISVFEMTKIRAGIATCIWKCNQEDRRCLSSREDYVLVCSFDFLGIKDFKFSNKSILDLKQEIFSALYIDILRERVVDDFFDLIGISRCNLVFSGGRHLHMFLPNTRIISNKIKRFINCQNDWLVSRYKLDLYISYGTCVLSNLKLNSIRENNYYLKCFMKIANQKALIEAQRYSAKNINEMNKPFNKSFDYFDSRFLLNENTTICISNDSKDGIPIGPNSFLSLDINENTYRKYVLKRHNSSKDSHNISIWLQDLALNEINELVISNSIGILRFDIDNFRKNMLNNTCIKGNITPLDKMELSKNFSFFLRRDMHILLRKSRQYNYKVFCMHEGADDAFLIGDMNDLIHFVILLINHYKSFTNNIISFSAGLAMVDKDKSLLENANIAQILMDEAKKIPGKDGIVLIEPDKKIKWEEFFVYAKNSSNQFS